VGFSVISEERSRGQELPPERPPKQLPWSENPSDNYFSYYIWANVVRPMERDGGRGLCCSVDPPPEGCRGSAKNRSMAGVSSAWSAVTGGESFGRYSGGGFEVTEREVSGNSVASFATKILPLLFS